MQTESIAFMHDGTASDVLPRLWRKCLQLLLFVLLYIDSRAWFTKGNFVDPTGGQEAFLAILVLFFLFAVLPKVLLKQKIDVNGLFVLVVIAFVLLVSPIGAWLTYGQPIYAGMHRRASSALLSHFLPGVCRYSFQAGDVSNGSELCHGFRRFVSFECSGVL